MLSGGESSMEYIMTDWMLANIPMFVQLNGKGLVHAVGVVIKSKKLSDVVLPIKRLIIVHNQQVFSLAKLVSLASPAGIRARVSLSKIQTIKNTRQVKLVKCHRY